MRGTARTRPAVARVAVGTATALLAIVVDGPARQAYFGTFRSMCLATDGTFYINDANLVIRKLTPAGQVTTWAF